AMAFAGASLVMAESTSFCTEDESPCTEANLISHIHETTLAESPAILLNSIGNVLCDVLFLGDTASGLASPLVINGNLTFSNCLRHKAPSGTEACTVSEVNDPAEVKVLKEGHETAKVTYQLEWKV